MNISQFLTANTARVRQSNSKGYELSLLRKEWIKQGGSESVFNEAISDKTWRKYWGLD